MSVISKIIKIKTSNFPPKPEYIEQKIIKSGIEPLRWAIIEVKESEVLVSVSGRELVKKNEI